MKTVEEIITYMEHEKAHCLEMHKNHRETNEQLALQYLISAITIEGLLAEITK